MTAGGSVKEPAQPSKSPVCADSSASTPVRPRPRPRPLPADWIHPPIARFSRATAQP